MAVYAEQYGLLFIGNPRTGSTAIGTGLVEHCGGRYMPEERRQHDGEIVDKQHSTLEQLVRLRYLDCPPEELLKFATVRNPFDSLVSKWAKRRYRKWPHRRPPNRLISFDSFVRRKIGDLQPQSMHAKFVDGVDRVIRFEQLEAELRIVLREVGAPIFSLKVVNPTIERIGHYRDYYSSESRALVEKIYAEDLIRFGYEY